MAGNEPPPGVAEPQRADDPPNGGKPAANEIPADVDDELEPEPAAEEPDPALAQGRSDEPKRAIVYIPHLGHTDGRSISDFATRLAAVLNQGDPERPPTYDVGETAKTVQFGRTSPKTTASALTLVRKTPTGESSIAIYEFSYSATLVERFDMKSSWRKTVTILLTVVLSFLRLVRSFVRASAPALRKWVVVVVCVNLLLLVGAVLYVQFQRDLNGWSYALLAGVTVMASVAWHIAPSCNASWKTSLAAILGGVAAIAGVYLAPVESLSTNEDLGVTILLLAGVLCIGAVWLTLGNPNAGQRLQLAIGFFLVTLMTLYGVFLVGAALGHGWAAANEGDTDVVEEAVGPWTGVPLALTALVVTVSPKKSRDALDRAMSHLVAAVRYLSEGEGRDSETGRFYELVEHLAELGFTSIDVVGYSFGSVVALDALYPSGTHGVPTGTRQVVKRLVTIGCPAVTIATFWPHYWAGRTPWGDDWVNVYSPLDVLSSRLRSGGAGAPPLAPVPGDGTRSPRVPKKEIEFNHANAATSDLTAFEKLTLQGLQAHARYWETPYDHDRGAIADIAFLWAGEEWAGAPLPGGAGAVAS